ncbi:hypothetical protein [Deinococcus sp. KSM4-11]|uniref:hypothetical protein n=1 Tax=Deinococcus sp. KSM4-11 TaxID=2568654 RepID=UPI001454D5FE|nr:hypothetical protein [Deinococcus sp. KSM4-11]
MAVYAERLTEVPVTLTVTELKALLECVRETPFNAPGQSSAANKIRAALKGMNV